MSDQKCFCHLNGYAVKDATARKDIEELKESITELQNKPSWRKVTLAELGSLLQEYNHKMLIKFVPTAGNSLYNTIYTEIILRNVNGSAWECYYSYTNSNVSGFNIYEYSFVVYYDYDNGVPYISMDNKNVYFNTTTNEYSLNVTIFEFDESTSEIYIAYEV